MLNYVFYTVNLLRSSTHLHPMRLCMLLCVLLLCSAGLQVRVLAGEPEKVFIINEGAFGQGNASMTVFYPGSRSVKQNVFYHTTGRFLGDVANDALFIENKLYIVVNNSHKIEIVDPENYGSLGTIFIDDEAHGASPRRMLALSDTKAYVSNLFGDNISVLDLENHTEVSTIDLGIGAGPEGMVQSAGNVFVALSGLGHGNEVAVIDPETDTVVERLQVGDNPIHLAVDHQGYVWVVVTGNFGFAPDFSFDPDLETFGKLVIIDPQTLHIVDEIETGGHPGKLVFWNESQALLQHEGLYLVDVPGRRLEQTPWLARKVHDFSIYSGQVEAVVYASYAPDFASSGRLVRYNQQAVALDSITAGIGPGRITFPPAVPTGSQMAEQVVGSFDVQQNYPNPFNPATTIPFEISAGGHVRMEIFDLLGRKLAVPVNGSLPAGSHRIRIDASNWPAGVYIYRLQHGGYTSQRSMTLLP